MLKCKFKPYEGNQPYIFISYAHKDSEQVFPILDELSDRGYRIWYDDGIAPGSEWPENIAQHLNACAVAVAFVTPNSMDSPNCRREITFALAKKKPFLGVMLEPTEMPLGMELQLSAQQCVLRYGCSSYENFLTKICSCPDLAPCWEEPPKPVPQPAPAPAPTPEPPTAEPPVSRTVPPVKASTVTADSEKASKPAKKKKTTSKGSKGSKKSKIGIAIGASVAAVVLLLTLLLVIPMIMDAATPMVTILPDLEVRQDTSYVSISDRQITDDALDNLGKLPDLSMVVLENCTFTTALRFPAQLTALSMRNCSGLGTDTQEMTFLGEMQKLMTLELINCGIESGMIPELSLPYLRTLDLSGNTNLSSIAPLGNCPALETAIFDNTSMYTVTILDENTNLIHVSFDNCMITSINALAKLPNLKILSFNNCLISEITVPFQSLRMEEVYFANNGLTSISGFDNLTVLKAADFSYNNDLYDLDCLEKSTATLERLNIAGFYNFKVESWLSSCLKLKELCVDDIDSIDISRIGSMQDLEVLSMINCDLKTTGTLSNLSKLHTLHLVGSSVGDASNLSKFGTGTTNILDLSFCNYTDATDLPRVNYELLSLLGNEVEASTLSGLSGSTLIITYNDSFTAAALPDGLSFNAIYIMDCPDDKKVAVEELFGQYRLHYLSSDNLSDLSNELKACGLDLERWLQE